MTDMQLYIDDLLNQIERLQGQIQYLRMTNREMAEELQIMRQHNDGRQYMDARANLLLFRKEGIQ